ncbi:cyclase [Nitrobacter vulgaris]|jgi:cyclase|uniref:HisA/HisF-related TIM barrel protein n=1 Tax=Nitrobacter vulgaris TaxID=29421 RepID=UPI00285EDDAD|nr:HisA/HisF-related TIM barrel protein [Nitrobacter vulgaris]MDR6304580.1 cyclase [Nitrobacter vulgaris]
MRPRIIPVLLLDSRRRLVKTRCFGNEVYVGDPFNVIRIFNEKEVDEICVFDINASIEDRRPDVGFISELASECFMPLSYGGGVRSVADATPIFAVGVEKIVLGRAGVDAVVVRTLADSFGSQAVAVCIDCRRINNDWRVGLDRGRIITDVDPVTRARAVEQAGAGEIILQSIEGDGERKGYNVDLISAVSTAVNVPVVALGGAGNVSHLIEGLRAGASAVASGSAFIFIGRLRAVLITYPSPEDIKDIFAGSGVLS